jgi:hypothetical protein
MRQTIRELVDGFRLIRKSLRIYNQVQRLKRLMAQAARSKP